MKFCSRFLLSLPVLVLSLGSIVLSLSPLWPKARGEREQQALSKSISGSSSTVYPTREAP